MKNIINIIFSSAYLLYKYALEQNFKFQIIVVYLYNELLREKLIISFEKSSCKNDTSSVRPDFLSHNVLINGETPTGISDGHVLSNKARQNVIDNLCEMESILGPKKHKIV